MVNRGSGCMVKDRMRRVPGGLPNHEFSHQARRCPGHLHVPKIQLSESERCTAMSAMSASTNDRPHDHGFGYQLPLNFKRELRVIVNVSLMSSGSFVQRHTSDSLH